MIEPSSVNCVIYHANCTDGFGAAYSAWKLLGNRAEYHACKHGDLPPDVLGKNVVILDFSFNNSTTKRLIKEANELLVIAWHFFHPGKESPKFIQYIEDRDLWKWELAYSKEFSAAFDMVPYEFEEFEMFEDDSVFDAAVKKGSYILAYSKTVVKKICDKASSRRIGGQHVMVVNSSHWMSEIGASLSKECDYALIWYYDHNDKNIKVSLRAFHEHIDVSDISKKFGGGGHKKAAGFMLSGDYKIEDLFDKEREC